MIFLPVFVMIRIVARSIIAVQLIGQHFPYQALAVFVSLVSAKNALPILIHPSMRNANE